ncbi:pilin [Psychrobacter sp. ANT_H3]|uniref:pilin n=1 Tax=Psychrobacter sp. ANT_H3 TaxID=3019444 RepID=UPI0022F1D930|nr:pilin [Psychrobacter sp. ANT_H3]MDA5133805.1 pilin [Psychrobacter sp. ANT_H3]
MNTAQKGFTLIELMIVVAIIGILAAIAIPQYQNYIAKSQVTRGVAELGALKTAVETCLNDGQTGAGQCDLGFTGSTVIGLTAPATVAAKAKPTTAVTNTAALTSTATIAGTFGGDASAALKDTATGITWSRTAAGTWSCVSTAPAKYNSSACPAAAAAGSSSTGG